MGNRHTKFKEGDFVEYDLTTDGPTESRIEHEGKLYQVELPWISAYFVAMRVRDSKGELHVVPEYNFKLSDRTFFNVNW